MGIEFNVRSATIDDLDDILRLNKALFDFEYDEGFTDSCNLDWTYSEDGKRVFRECIEQENKTAFVALNDQGQTVGYLAAVVATKTFCNPPIVSEIDNMFIDEKYRCSGIGKTLVEEFKKWSKEKNAGLLSVGAWASNKHARDFYEKWGFKEVSVNYQMRAE